MFAANPFDTRDVVAGLQLSADHLAHVIHEQIMILGAATCVLHDAFENSKHLHRFYAQSGFLQDLAPDRFIQSLAGLDQPARQRPEALQRMAAALDQENGPALAAPLENQRADAGQRMRGISSF